MHLQKKCDPIVCLSSSYARDKGSFGSLDGLVYFLLEVECSVVFCGNLLFSGRSTCLASHVHR